MADIRDRLQRGEKLRMTDDVPWYVTNKDAHGLIYRYTITAWFMLWAPLLVAVNILIWSCIGLVVGALLVIHTVAGMF